MVVIDNKFVVEKRKLMKMLISKTFPSTSLSRENMDNLVTDTIIKCLINARYCTEDYNVNTWLGLQVRSAVAEWVGDQVKQGENPEIHGLQIDEEFHPPVPDPETDEDAMDYLRDKLKPYLSVLSDTERQVMVYHVYNRLSVNQIAERMDMHASSISSIKKRAEGRIKYVLKKGRTMNSEAEVSPDMSRGVAIMQLPDVQYHSYRLHYFKGMSIGRTAAMMGQPMMVVVAAIEDTKRHLKQLRERQT